uniref:CSON009943 protein n=1 Tax=Culicoides sonorensis TaxID=179676 RepID=A0A336K0Z9_CULSO
MTDEDVIRRRLLIDADGTGDDRRLNVLMKSFIRWCNTTDTPENTEVMHDRMLAQIAQCEFVMKKSHFSSQIMTHELKNYEKISETIASGIENVKEQIDQNKENLLIAKQIRRNRMEYDSLAKIINQQPDRQNTIAKLNALKEELEQLEGKSANLEKKLEKRQKDFTVLMRAVVELQKELSDSSGDEEEEEGTMETSSSEEGEDHDNDEALDISMT